MQAPGTSSVNAGKIEGLTLSVLMPKILEMVQLHPRGLMDMTSLDELSAMLTNGVLDVWGAGSPKELKIVALTQTSLFSRNRTLFVIWVGGTDFKTYGPALLDTAEKWCALHGVKQISANGRLGWKRTIGKFGFSFPRVEMVKTVGYTLDDEQKVVRSN